MIALLVRYGADVNMRNIEGESPLHIACQRGLVSCVEKLIKLKADVWALDYRHRGVIDSAKLWMVGYPENSARIQECIDLISRKRSLLVNSSGVAMTKSVQNNFSFLLPE